MMMLYDQLQRKKQLFTPQDPNCVTMYVCGPTVHSDAHIGNMRSVVVYDVLYRVLRATYGDVKYIRNVTDIDDKIVRNARRRRISPREVASRSYKEFLRDVAILNCMQPTQQPHVTDHMSDIIALIVKLLDNDSAYVAGSDVYFRVSSFKDYGCLSKQDRDSLIAGARIGISDKKEDCVDFVLWKGLDRKREHRDAIWDSPWGPGRPGWHIECSAISTTYLGKTFDIHGGGADLQFPHHENELAQSRCAHPGEHYARFWLHNGFLTVRGKKMSKSVGNVVLASRLISGDMPPEAIRYSLLMTHYRKPLDWTDELVESSKRTLDGFYEALDFLGDAEVVFTNDDIDKRVLECLHDDLNVPEALARLHEIKTELKNKSSLNDEVRMGLARTLYASADLLGILSLTPSQWFSSDIDKFAIEELIAERAKARLVRDYIAADKIRNRLYGMGIEILDRSRSNTVWRKMIRDNRE